MDCVICKAELTSGRINHIVDLNEHIIIIKNVPANICKQCGESFIEHEIAKKIEKIIENAKITMAEFLVINYDENVA